MIHSGMFFVVAVLMLADPAIGAQADRKREIETL